jgi:hypothetical protein
MKNIKLLVCGSRDWTDRDLIYDWLNSFNMSEEWLGITLIHGAARGADTIAALVAKSFAWNIKPYPAEWEKYGKIAGPIRNREMIKENPDIVLAFHSNLKESKGTKDMVLLAVSAGIETHLITGKL